MISHFKTALVLSTNILLCSQLKAQNVTSDSISKLKKQLNGKQTFRINKPDFKVSPHTGMTRTHWQEAGLYLLSGAFSYVKNIDDRMIFAKQPGKSYPKNEGQIPTEALEGLCRTLFIATPLLKENPALKLNNIGVAEYYRHQIVKLTDPASPSYIKPRAANGGPSQNLVEFGALAISLFSAPEILWDPLTDEQKKALSSTMLSYGDGPTIPSNWKFFNIFVLSFFKSRGYTVNDKLLEDYVVKSLEHYSGGGWYSDHPAYDYYSMWAFQMYGTLWSEFFGKKYYPQYAQKFIANFKDLKGSYPYMFSRNGKMIMWGRSISYRMGAAIPMPLMGLLKDPEINYGWMRRIASGVLLQFIENPGLLADNVPTLGFYGAFEPAVQSYSCRGSAFWMGKAFLSLLIPKDNPFWTAIENEGPWEKDLAKKKVYNKFSPGANILITDYPAIGAAEIRAWCNVPVIGAGEPFRGSENYNRLSYNSAFEWQADGPNGEVAMNYVFKTKKSEWEAARLFDFKKFEDGIYYRNVVLETNKNIKMNLADITLPNGILRIDRNNSTDSIDLRLGHYALPAVKGAIKKQTRKVNGHEVQIINNGTYQLAMVPVIGWEKIAAIDTKGLNPVNDQSTIINVSGTLLPNKKSIYGTLMLWKKAGETFTDTELYPIKSIVQSAQNNTIDITFLNGDKKTVKFDAL